MRAQASSIHLDLVAGMEFAIALQASANALTFADQEQRAKLPTHGECHNCIVSILGLVVPTAAGVFASHPLYTVLDPVFVFTRPPPSLFSFAPCTALDTDPVTLIKVDASASPGTGLVGARAAARARCVRLASIVPSRIPAAVGMAHAALQVEHVLAPLATAGHPARSSARGMGAAAPSRLLVFAREATRARVALFPPRLRQIQTRATPPSLLGARSL